MLNPGSILINDFANNNKDDTINSDLRTRS